MKMLDIILKLRSEHDEIEHKWVSNEEYSAKSAKTILYWHIIDYLTSIAFKYELKERESITNKEYYAIKYGISLELKPKDFYNEISNRTYAIPCKQCAKNSDECGYFYNRQRMILKSSRKSICYEQLEIWLNSPHIIDDYEDEFNDE